ncbi:MAG: response regulator [Pseudomonadota bacterium]
MRVLIVQDNRDLGTFWTRFLRRQGVDARLVGSEEDALDALERGGFDALILEPVMTGCSGLCVADVAAFRYPDMPVIAVTKSSFFADGSIFSLIPNARGFLRAPVDPADLVAYLDHIVPAGDLVARADLAAHGS